MTTNKCQMLKYDPTEFTLRFRRGHAMGFQEDFRRMLTDALVHGLHFVFSVFMGFIRVRINLRLTLSLRRRIKCLQYKASRASPGEKCGCHGGFNKKQNVAPNKGNPVRGFEKIVGGNSA